MVPLQHTIHVVHKNHVWMPDTSNITRKPTLGKRGLPTGGWVPSHNPTGLASTAHHGAFTAHGVHPRWSCARGAQKPRAWWRAPHVSDEQDAKCRAPHVSDEQDATHAAWSPAGSRALTVMAAGRHAARSSVGASAPVSAALVAHPTVPVALPAPLCSVPPTSLPAMPVAPPTLTTQP